MTQPVRISAKKAKPMRISTIVLVILVCFSAMAQADTFEVLVVGTAATANNLRSLKIDGKPKYPDMHWLPVAEIRSLLKKP